MQRQQLAMPESHHCCATLHPGQPARPPSLVLFRSALALHTLLGFELVAGCELNAQRLATGMLAIAYGVKMATMRRPDLMGDTLEEFGDEATLRQKWRLCRMDLEKARRGAGSRMESSVRGTCGMDSPAPLVPLRCVALCLEPSGTLRR